LPKKRKLKQAEAASPYDISIKPEGKRHGKIASAHVAGIPRAFLLTDEFRRAINVMENTHNHIYITGKAGTGKSTLLQYFKENTRKNIAVLAPTGIAAVNVGGSTIHSFFRFKPRLMTKDDVTEIRSKKEVFSALEMLVIDEVSMVRADIMDGIDYSLRINRNRPGEPFGGVQVVLFGDLFQLPPVTEGEELTRYFTDYYGSPYFFSAGIFKDIQLERIELKRVFRQSDPVFLDLLNKIRNNQATYADLAHLNQRCTPYNPDNKDGLSVTLTSTNALASEINLSKLSGLSSAECRFEASVDGDFDEAAFPTERTLRLKPGAQVMMVKNDPKKRWVNGTLGVVEKVTADSVKIRLPDSVCSVECSTWEKIDYEYDRDKDKILPVVKGSFTQYPVKLAWALTIHKSQGKTFKNVFIDLGKGAFAHGQVYVALSRCTSLEGIRLRAPVKRNDIILDPRVQAFLG